MLRIDFEVPRRGGSFVAICFLVVVGWKVNWVLGRGQRRRTKRQAGPFARLFMWEEGLN